MAAEGNEHVSLAKTGSAFRLDFSDHPVDKAYVLMGTEATFAHADPSANVLFLVLVPRFTFVARGAR